VVVDQADFTSAATSKLVHLRSDPSQNNVLRGHLERDLTSQPSCIVAFGFGGGRDVAHSTLCVIAVNELTGLDSSGNVLPEIANIKARYKSAKVLPIRSQLVPFARPLGDQKIAKPFFVKDDESKNLAQLVAFAQRELANHQMKALTVDYDVVGHTYNGHPWTVNTLVAVQDEVLSVTKPLWVLERTFNKSVAGGTTTSLRLIEPYTLQIAT
jgi:hypothetical protein